MDTHAGPQVRVPSARHRAADAHSQESCQSHASNIAVGGRPAHGFVVDRQAGTAVWHWTHGQVILSILQRRTLLPGDALTFAGQWQQMDSGSNAVSPGPYV